MSFDKITVDCDVRIENVWYVNRKTNSLDSATEIINKYAPDIIHLHGTENSFIRLLAEKHLGRLVISLQGIMEDIRKFTLPDDGFSYLRYPVMVMQGFFLRWLYSRRAEFERQALRVCRNISGRTAYDEYYSLFLNSERSYYPVQRVIRREFVPFRWNLEKCNPDLIVTNLKVVPAKGLHILLRAFKIVKLLYPGLRLKVIGARNSRARPFSYAAFVNDLLHRWKLETSVEFTGYLKAETIGQELVSCRLFVLPSLMENNSNSLCEAMYTGMPCVCAHTGGLASMLQDEETGLLFSNGNSYHLAAQIIRLLKDDTLSQMLARNAYEIARKRHNQEDIVQQTETMYLKIMETYEYT